MTLRGKLIWLIGFDVVFLLILANLVSAPRVVGALGIFLFLSNAFFVFFLLRKRKRQEGLSPTLSAKREQFGALLGGAAIFFLQFCYGLWMVLTRPWEWAYLVALTITLAVSSFFFSAAWRVRRSFPIR
jgi:hypothetical protein